MDTGALDTGATASATDTAGPDWPATDANTVDEATTNIPPSCQVQTQTAAPYAVTFRIRNRRATSVFRHTGCWSELMISTCASNYWDQLSTRVQCACDCTGICPTCGLCPEDAGVELAAGATYEESWNGQSFTMSTRPDSRACQLWKAMPAGRYRARLPLYNSAADAKVRSPLADTASVDFELPAVGGVVNLDIGP